MNIKRNTLDPNHMVSVNMSNNDGCVPLVDVTPVTITSLDALDNRIAALRDCFLKLKERGQHFLGNEGEPVPEGKSNGRDNESAIMRRISSCRDQIDAVINDMDQFIERIQ